jgi:hypothetical protein
LVALASAGVGIGLAYLLGLRDAGMGLMCFGFVSVALIVLVIWELLNPPPFRVEVGSENAQYQFRDRGYAQDFATLNGLLEPTRDLSQADGQ